MRILPALAGLAMLAAAHDAKAAAYTEYGAWQQAFFDLQATMPEGVQLGLVPINVSLIAITDGYGSFTDPSQLVLASIGHGQPPSEWVSRAYGGSYFNTSLGSFSANFGCHSAFYPCLGSEVIEIAFSQPVFGLAGQLTYATHMVGGDSPGYGEPIIPFEAAFSAATSRVYEGFFGFIDEIETLRMSRAEGMSLDDYGAQLTFTGFMIVPVPEPAMGLTLLAGAALLLAARRRSESAAA